MSDPDRSARTPSVGARRRREARWWGIAGAGVAAAVLGFVGMRQYARATGGSTGFLDLAYRDLQLFVLESGSVDASRAMPAALQVARFLAPAVGAAAVLGVLVGLFREEVESLRVRRFRGHTVICGLGAEGLALAQSLRRRGRRVVAIERDAENDRIVSCRAAGVPVVVGDAADPDALRGAGVPRARRVVVVCGDSAVNTEVVATLHRLTEGRASPLDCIVHVDEPRLGDLLRTRYLAAAVSDGLRLDVFNVYERAAQVLLLRHPFFGDDAAPGTGEPHAVVVGLGRLGQRLVLEAARAWRAVGPGPSSCFRVTVIDRDAATAVRALTAVHAEVRGVCELVALPIDVRGPEFEEGAFLPADAPPVTVAYVCLGDDALALRTALVLRQWLPTAPIVVRSERQVSVPALLGGRTADTDLAGMHGFAVVDRTCDADTLVGGTYEVLAQALQERYVRHREAQGWVYGNVLDPATRRDPALAPWPELAEDLRESNRAQATHTAVKLAAVGCRLAERVDWDAPVLTFTVDEVERLGRLEHERWVAERIAAGWRPGPRDPARRRTPYLVPYDDLPEDVKEYDRMFVRALPAVLVRLGVDVVREPS